MKLPRAAVNLTLYPLYSFFIPWRNVPSSLAFKTLAWSHVYVFRTFVLVSCTCVLTKPQSHLTLCGPMDCSLTGTFVHGILQARILEWVVMPFSKGSSRSRDPTRVSCSPCIAGGFFTATREAPVGVLFKDLSALMLGPVSFLCNSALSCQTSNVFFFFLLRRY